MPVDAVIDRIVAMLRAGTIRRVRQTLLSTSLAGGALCAWEVPPEKLDAAFDFMFRADPFSGHVVIRTTDTVSAGSNYRLWTTLKVPPGYSLRKHAEWLRERVGATAADDHRRTLRTRMARAGRSQTRVRARGDRA